MTNMPVMRVFPCLRLPRLKHREIAGVDNLYVRIGAGSLLEHDAVDLHRIRFEFEAAVSCDGYFQVLVVQATKCASIVASRYRSQDGSVRISVLLLEATGLIA